MKGKTQNTISFPSIYLETAQAKCRNKQTNKNILTIHLFLLLQHFSCIIHNSTLGDPCIIKKKRENSLVTGLSFYKKYSSQEWLFSNQGNFLAFKFIEECPSSMEVKGLVLQKRAICHQLQNAKIYLGCAHLLISHIKQ